MEVGVQKQRAINKALIATIYIRNTNCIKVAGNYNVLLVRLLNL